MNSSSLSTLIKVSMITGLMVLGGSLYFEHAATTASDSNDQIMSTVQKDLISRLENEHRVLVSIKLDSNVAIPAVILGYSVSKNEYVYSLDDQKLRTIPASELEARLN